MKTTGMVMVLALAVSPVLAAQQPAPVNPPAPRPPERVVERQGMDLEAARAREMAYAADRRDGGGDPLERFLIPPELIMRRQREIGLQPAQRTQITQIIGRLEASLVEFQWAMQEQQQALAEMLQQPQVNADAALQALDRVLATETSVKRAHFQALLQIRNVLTVEQQNQLRTVRGEPGRDDEER